MTRGGRVAIGGVTLALVIGGAVIIALLRPDEVPPARPPVPDPPTAHMQEPVALLIARSREAVLADPASAEAWGRLGAVFDAHGLDGHAAACYERAMQLDPGDFRWVYFLGIVRDVLGAPPDEAIELLRAAAALAPRYPPVHARMADVLARAGRWAEAQTVYEHVLELAPDYPIARRGLGQALLARGDAAAAAGQLEYAIRLRDGDRGTYAALAQAYARLGREGDARAAAEAARDMSTAFSYRDSIRGQNVGDVATSSTAVMNRARFMMANDQWELALADLKLAEQMLPEDAWVQHQLGRVYRRLGRNDLAEHHFARARALQQE